jgi:uncharacterized protein YjbJ (UPF0337 family)
MDFSLLLYFNRVRYRSLEPDKRLQAKGKAQKTLGNAQARFGDVKRRVKESSRKQR